MISWNMGVEEDIEFGWLCQLIQKTTHQRSCVEGVLKILWFLGLVTLISLLVAMFFVESPAMLVGAFAILIAAFTASFSVMHSIMTSKLMEEEKRIREMHKHKNFVLQLLFNLQDLLSRLNNELQATCGREPLKHKSEDINQLLKRYHKILGYLESENTLIHLDSEEIGTIFDLIEASEKWLKPVNLFLENPELCTNLDNDIDGYTSYYISLENRIPEAMHLFAKDLG